MVGAVSVVSYGMSAGYMPDDVSVGASESGNVQSSKFQDLLKRIRNSDEYERQRAAIELGNLGDPRAVPILIEALKDQDDFVRNFAARSLGNLKDSRAVDPLIAAIEDKNLLVRRSAVESLGFIGDKKAVDPLIEATRSGDDIVRRAAVEALGRIGDPNVTEYLIAMLREDDIYMQNGAADALAAIGQTTIPQLVPELSDWMIGPRILEILKRFEWQPSTDEERIWFYVASRDRQSILKDWNMASKVLIGNLGQRDDKRIEDSVFALIGIGQDESIEELLKIIKENGTQAIAKAYVDSGNDILVKAAQEWAQQNGSEIQAGGKQPGVQWGAMKSSSSAL